MPDYPGKQPCLGPLTIPEINLAMLLHGDSNVHSENEVSTRVIDNFCTTYRL